MQLPALQVDTREVQQMISGGTATESIPDPIACLIRAEITGWRIDSCRFLVAESLTSAYQERERAYFLEAAGMQLASVFDVLLHEVVSYYGFTRDIPPKEVRWGWGRHEPLFQERLKTSDATLEGMLRSAQQEAWFQKIKGLRHFLTHHGCLLQHMEVHIGDGERRAYRIPGDEYFEKERHVGPPDSFTNGCIDRVRLPLEVISGLQNMCGVVDRVRQHCFDHAPAFYWGRLRRQSSR